MKTRDLRHLLARAAAALETPADLTETEKREVVEDLRAAEDELAAEDGEDSVGERLSTDEQRRGGVDHEADDVTAVPADLSEESLIGWVALLRITALGLPPTSPEREAFLARAGRNLNFAAWLLRESKARSSYLRAEAQKLPDLLSTVVD